MDAYNDSGTLSNSDITSPGQDAMIAFIVLLEIFVALVSNGFIMVVTITKKASIESPRSVIMLTNLTIANLFQAVLYMPIVVMSAINRGLIFGAAGQVPCHVFAVMFQLCTFATIFTIIAICIDRYVAIVQHYKWKRMTMKSAVLNTVLIWGWSTMLSIFPLAGYGVSEYLPEASICIVLWLNAPFYISALFASSMFSLAVIILSGIATSCLTVPCIGKICDENNYLENIRHIYRNRETGRNEGTGRNGDADGNTVPEMYSKGCCCNLIGMVCLLLVTFFVCYIPIAVVAIGGLIPFYDGMIPAELGPFIVWLPFLYIAILNPAIQIYYRKELRENFIKLMGKIFELPPLVLSPVDQPRNQQPSKDVMDEPVTSPPALPV